VLVFRTYIAHVRTYATLFHIPTCQMTSKKQNKNPLLT